MKMILAKISKHGQSLEDFECVRAVPVKPTFHLFTWEGMSHPSVGGWGGPLRTCLQTQHISG